MAPKTKLCSGCNQQFEARPNAKVCSSRCRKRLHRAKQSLQREVQKLAQLRQAAIADIQNSLVPSQLAAVAVEAPSDYDGDNSLGPSDFDFLKRSYADTGSVATAVHPVGHIISPRPPVAPGAVQHLVAPVTQSLASQSLMPAPEIQSLETKPSAQHWQQLQNSWQTPPSPPAVIGTPTVLKLDEATTAPGGSNSGSGLVNFFKSRPIFVGLGFMALIVIAAGIFGLGKALHFSSSTSQHLSQLDQALSVDSAAGTLTLNLDTTVAKGKTLTVGQIIAGPGSSILQVTGDVQSSSTLYASNGQSSLNNIGLTINGAVVCTSAGCIPLGSGDFSADSISRGQLSNIRLSPNVTLQGNTFNGPSLLVQLTGAGLLPVLSGANLTNLNASNIAFGTVGDIRLSANVALLNRTGPQTFTGNNKFTGTFLHQNAADSTSAFQIQNAAGNTVFNVDTANQFVGIGTQGRQSPDGGPNLSIYSTNPANWGQLELGSSTTTSNAQPGKIVFTNLSTTNADKRLVTLLAKVDASSPDLGASFAVHTKPAGGSGAERFRIAGNGNVGVGNFSVSDPTATLQVAGNALFKNVSNSTTAFQIQNAAGTSLLTANTSSGQILLPNATSAATSLVLGGDANLYRVGADTLKTDDSLIVAGQLYTDSTLNVRQGTTNYIRIGQGAPSIEFGQTSDTNLYRSAADTLKTDDALIVGTLGSAGTTALCSNAGQISTCAAGGGSGNFIVNGTSLQASANFNIQAVNSGLNGTVGATIQGAAGGQTVDLFQLKNTAGTTLTAFQADGKLVFGPSGAQDTNLYRSAADTLRTDDKFQSSDHLIASVGTAGQVRVGGSSTRGEITFGGSEDTNLYRYAANVLKTDDNFLVQTAANSTTAFQVQNAVGTSVLNVDTIGGNITQTFTNAIYKGGGDSSGSTNSGTGGSNFNSITISGRYAYAAKGADATACSGTAGSAIGCELQVYDVSNPSTPTYIGGADASGSTNAGTGESDFYSITVSGRYAYVANNGNPTACSGTAGSAIGCELQVYDISNPSAPTYVGGADVSGSTNAGTGSDFFFGVTVSGRYAYAAKGADATACSQTAGSAIGCEIQVYDVANPASPTYIGGADASGSTNSGTGGTAHVLSITVSGRYAYAAKGADATACSQTAGSAIGCEMQVYDVANPASPTYIGGVDASGSTNAGTGESDFYSITVSGRYAYAAKGADATACSGTAGSAIGCELQAYDVSNPSTPTYKGGADASGSTNSGTGGSINFNSITVSGRYAYAANSGDATACSQTAGSAIGCELQVYDVANPASPTYKGGADASGSTNSGTGNSKFWGVTVSGHYAYVAKNANAPACSGTAGSAIGCELQAYDVSGLEATSVLAHSLEAGSLQVQGGATLAADVSIQGGLTIGQNLQVSGNIGASGQVLFQSSTNSTSAFQIQNTSGNNYLSVDTSGATVSVGNTGIASTIQIGNTTGAVAQTINIGNNATASSTSAITIGNLLGTSATTIQGGTGASAIALTQGSGGTITIGGTGGASAVIIQSGTGDITFKGHLQSSQATKPTIGTPSSCGTSPTASVANGSTDSAGMITITTGSAMGGGDCATVVTYTTAYATTPKAILFTASGSASADKFWYVAASGTTSYTVALNTLPASSTAHDLYYWVIE